MLRTGKQGKDMHEESVLPTYRIRVRGNLDPRWSEWLESMSIRADRAEADSPTVVLTGPLVDQAALRGVLNRLWDLNLEVISVNRMAGHREES
jgi:hypothetical protein